MYGCSSDYVYAIKCLFKDSPLALIGIVFVASILIFSISLRIAERYFSVYEEILLWNTQNILMAKLTLTVLKSFKMPFG